jgi:hypothetical protein
MPAAAWFTLYENVPVPSPQGTLYVAFATKVRILLTATYVDSPMASVRNDHVLSTFGHVGYSPPAVTAPCPPNRDRTGCQQ